MLSKPSEFQSSGNFFSPKELSTAVAILFEPKKVILDAPRTFNNVQTGTGTDTITDLTIFENQAMLDGTTPPTIKKGVRVDKNGVNRTLASIVDGAVAGRLIKRSTKAGNTEWVVDDIAPDVHEKVAAYFAARDAAADAAPSFD